jgi:UDP-N-acetyl-D-mannosaminuronic acid dehydrogenase
MHRVSIIGLGYIGLPLAAFIANKGFDVTGIDIDKNIIKNIKINNIKINDETKINKILQKTIKQGFFKASLNIEPADIFVICVPTPVKKNKKPDFSIIFNVAKQIAPKLKKNNLIVIESTIGPGVTRDVSVYLQKLREDLIFPHNLKSNISIAHCPERVIPGNIYNEFLFNPRIIGGITKKCAVRTKLFYEKFIIGKLHLTEALTAELTKISENSFRDTNIAFANEIDLICRKYQVNTKKLIKLSNLHPRVNILSPGPGVGGHCIPVDPYFLIDKNQNITKLIQTSRIINNNRPLKIIKNIKNKINLIINKKNKKKILIYFYGLTYKKNVDDFRNSPALQILTNLSKSVPGKIIAIDPFIKKNLISNKNIKFYKYKKPIIKIDLIINAVNHQEFKKINFSKYKEKLISLV